MAVSIHGFRLIFHCAFCFSLRFTSVTCCPFLFFFFQAEDGIRDIGVTGVQTCALPICFTWERIILPTTSNAQLERCEAIDSCVPHECLTHQQYSTTMCWGRSHAGRLS